MNEWRAARQDSGGARHESGWQKQSNKAHKRDGGHTSKRAVAAALGGKVQGARSVSGASVSRGGGGSAAAVVGREARANQAALIRKSKRSALLSSRRLGGGSGGLVGTATHAGSSSYGAPRTVGVVLLSGAARVPELMGPAAASLALGSGALASVFPKERFRCVFVVAAREALSVLDVAKTADVLLMVLPLHQPEHSVAGGKAGALGSFLEGAVDEMGRTFITLCKSQGMPAVVGVLQGLDAAPHRLQPQLKKQATNFFIEEFGEGTKMCLDAAPPASGDSTMRDGATPGDEAAAAVSPHGSGFGSEHMNELQFALIRAVMETTLRTIAWRSERSYLLGCAAAFEPSAQGERDGQGVPLGTLKVSGYLRGRPLDVHQLVHITGHGTYRVSRIDAPTDPFPLPRKGAKESKAAQKEQLLQQLQQPPRVLAVADPAKRRSLVEEATPDIMAGEQTWPTEEEEAAAGQEDLRRLRKEKARLKRERAKLPPGTSDYQATWLMGVSDDEEQEEEEEEEEEDELMRKDDKGASSKGAEEEEEDDEEGNDDEEVDEEAGITLAEWKAKQTAEKDEVEFPDEVDTPIDIAAKDRFAKYRGLKSFRASPWHPKESLPREYARIFQVDNPVGLRNQVLEEGAALEHKWLSGIEMRRARAKAQGRGRSGTLEAAAGGDADADMTEGAPGGEAGGEFSSVEGCVAPGQWVTVHVEGVAANVLGENRQARLPLVLGALLEHENRLTVLNATVIKNAAYERPVRSRDALTMSCGLWRRPVRPCFSENTIGTDKHKFERFLHHGRWSVATVYAPLTIGSNVPVLLLDGAGAACELVASGSLLSVDPDRIVLKKVVLSGHPLRVKRYWAVIRYMFFRPDDVRWFKPVDLWTKHGGSGRIVEPLGTHGLFKCTFNKPIKNNDTVCMSLYKRVFPKPVNEFKGSMMQDA